MQIQKWGFGTLYVLMSSRLSDQSMHGTTLSQTKETRARESVSLGNRSLSVPGKGQ